MYSDKTVEIKITNQNYEFYKNKGYEVKLSEMAHIKCKDVKQTVATRIFVICEVCKTEKKIVSANYHLQITRSGFYTCKKCSHVKIKETNLKKYGYVCPLQNKIVSEKSKSTLMEKYGVDNISKAEHIKLDRHDNFRNDNFKIKSKNTWMEKYGVDNPSKSNEIKQKKEITCLKNHGVDNPSQSPEIFQKSQISGKKIKLHKTGLYYRGTYEKDFLDFCENINIEVFKGPTVEYEINGKKKYYHSDFYIKKLDLICEIKSSYYYEKYKEINECKKIYSEKEHNFIFIINKDYSDIEKLINGI